MQNTDLFAEYGMDMPVRLPLHKNPGLEIVYIKRGHLAWECEGCPETILPESIYFTLPWQEHGSTKLFESGYEIYFIVIKLNANSLGDPFNVEFKPSLGFPKEDEQAISQLLCNCSQHAWPASPPLQMLLPEILQELTRPGSFHTTRIHTLLKQVILELARTIEQDSSQPVCPISSSWRLQGLLKKIDHTFNVKWTLAAMAAETGLKRTQFSKLFKQITGESPLNYLTNLRITKAARMLENTTCSITKIAFQCGFSSSQHFAHAFKKKIGQAPLKYRKKGPPDIQVPRRS
jgi:AraC family L-rhamnose operon regulatory protein RhaS